MDRTGKWNVHRLPLQHGKTFLVTGASSGIGYFIVEQLAQTRAHIVLSGRNTAKLAAATTAVLNRVPAARLSTLVMDLADFGSIRAAVTKIGALEGPVLNAGLLTQRHHQMTADGHEMVYGTNHLG